MKSMRKPIAIIVGIISVVVLVFLHVITTSAQTIQPISPFRYQTASSAYPVNPSTTLTLPQLGSGTYCIHSVSGTLKATSGDCNSGGAGTVGPSTSTYVAVFNASGTVTGYLQLNYVSSTQILTIGSTTINGIGESDFFSNITVPAGSYVGFDGINSGYTIQDFNNQLTFNGPAFTVTFPSVTGQVVTNNADGVTSSLASWVNGTQITAFPTGTAGYVITASSTGGVPYWAASVGGGGSSTVLYAGHAITLSPNPISTTGTVAVATGTLYLDFSAANCLTYNTSTGQFGSTCITTSSISINGVQGNVFTGLATSSGINSIAINGFSGVTFNIIGSGNVTTTNSNGTTTISISGAIPIANGGTGATSSAAALTNLGGISTSTYNASITIATAAPLGGGGQLTNGGTLNLTCTGCLTSAVQSLSNNSVAGGIDFSAATGTNITGVLHSLAISQFTGNIVNTFNGATGTYNLYVAGTGLTIATGTASTTITWTNPGYIATSTNLTTANFTSANISQWTNNSNFITFASSGTWTAAITHTATTTFASTTIFSGSVSSTEASALILAGATGIWGSYGGAAVCTNAGLVSTISAVGATTCVSSSSEYTALGLGTIATHPSTDYITSSTNMVNTLNGTTGNYNLYGGLGITVATGTASTTLSVNQAAALSFSALGNTTSTANIQAATYTGTSETLTGNQQSAQLNVTGTSTIIGNSTYGTSTFPANVNENHNYGGTTTTILLGASGVPFCFEGYDSVNTTTLEYIYTVSAVWTVTTTKPAFCL